VTPRAIVQAVRLDLRRDRQHLVAAATSVVLAVAALVFLLGLVGGVRSVLLGKVFVPELIEVAPRAVDVDLGPLRFDLGSADFSPADIERLRAIQGVAAVYPKMKLVVPAVASGGRSILGRGAMSEIVADGIEPELVAGEVAEGYDFVDPGYANATAGGGPCHEDAQCPTAWYCQPVSELGGGQCRRMVPVVASTQLIEIYNGTVRRAYGLPKLNPDSVIGFTFELDIGASTLRPRRSAGSIRERAVLVGFSEAAIPVGVTLPLETVRRYNDALAGTESSDRYHTAVVRAKDRREVPRVLSAVRDLGFSVISRGAEQASLLTAALTVLAVALGVVLLAAATVNISHVFLMLVARREREIGLMRALGAAAMDLRTILYVEAALVGFVAGVAGVVLAMAAARGCDSVAARMLPDFPFKPETFFALGGVVPIAAVLLAVLGSVAGSHLAARRAAKLDPSTILAGR